MISRHENVIGTPEKPLSDVGEVVYKSYWRSAIFEHVYKESFNITTPSKRKFSFEGIIQNYFNFYSFYSTNLNLDISAATGIAIPDIIDTLKEGDLIVNDGRYSLVLIYYFHFHVWYLSLTVDFDIDAIKQHWDEAHMKTSRIWLDASKLKVND